MGSVSTLDICVLENTTSPRFLINALLQFLEKSLRDIPELYVQFYQGNVAIDTRCFSKARIGYLTNVTLALRA